MERIRNFLRDRAFLWVVLACAAAAVLVGVWAVRSVQQNLTQPEQDGASGADVAGLEPYPGLENEAMEGQEEWDTGWNVAGRADGVPEEEKNAQSGQSASASSWSGSASGQASGAGQQGSGASAGAAAPLYAQPVSGSVIKAFSGDELVYSKTLADWRTHNGVDYGCSTGAAVYAPASGRVSLVAADGNWGGVIEITDEAGLVWRLCGVTARGIAQGDSVVTGQQLGEAGTIGCENADGTHIHLELKQDGKYLDPAGKIG